MTQQLRQLADSLLAAKPVAFLSKQEHSLFEVAAGCQDVSAELTELLDELKAKNSKSKRHLTGYHTQQLSLELLNSFKSESLKRLDRLIVHGQASGDDLRSLNRNLESLRLGSNVTCLSPEALDQIRSLLRLSDDAVLKVRQARIIDALRFELMNERFEDIEEAHKKTFDWIFENTDTRSVSIDNGKGTDNPKPMRRSKPSRVVVVHNSHRASQSVYLKTGRAIPIRRTQRVITRTPPRSYYPTPGWVYAGSEHSDYTYSGRSYYADSEYAGCAHSECSMSTSEYSCTTRGFTRAIEDVGSDDGPSPPTGDVSAELVEDPPHIPSAIDDDTGYDEAEDEHSRNDDEVEARHQLWDRLSEARDSFIGWLKHGSGIFYISGKPGSGKSTLMKYIAGGKTLALGKFFFWKPGSPLQKSINGLIRALLHCLLSECASLIPLVFPAQWEASIHREKIYVENHECQPAFERLLNAKQTYEGYKFAFFLDGLDEFEGDHASFLRKLLAWANATQNVKLCVSSREWPIFQNALKDCPTFRLQDLTTSDIRRVGENRLHEMCLDALASDDDYRKLHLNVDIVSHLIEEIVQESDGVFLWVLPILRYIENGLANGDRMSDIMKVISSLPTELEPMLQQILEPVPRHNQLLAYSMLSLARWSSLYDIQVFLTQYSFLEEYTANRDFAMDLPVKFFTAKENSERLERATKRVYGVCKGLIELRRPRDRFKVLGGVLGDVVHLIHRSVAEFLESQFFQQRIAMCWPASIPLTHIAKHTWLD
ncbi:uncharacterized protein F4822DRAFT_443533 [Hypoxylon trugodes]|uniref:uncharacterized protein n=1 Tax=Hypoxylon trugodes TaxID=326681 RepID=UPI00218EF69C|nr:uncharacterized protein F4822DRAFT_443533 [Hypoxylon trugodes]KAI1388692.1 hypothetical protein F4822DRAFT_443533 [Hypoxylon trugodes]